MRSLQLLSIATLATGALRAAPTTLYVATNGNDGWSGRIAAPAADGKDGPKATLGAALVESRSLRTERLAPEGVRIQIRGGRYELHEPVRLGADDSGLDANRPFVIEAYPGESPVLSGGRRISGWHKVEAKPGVWEVEIPDVREGKWFFRQLFIDGKRKQRARTPNAGFFRIQGASPQDKPVKIKFRPGDIRKEWAEYGDVELIALLAWADLRMPIRAVNEADSVATLAGNPRPSNQESNARYFIENAPDALDAPGEWYLNKKSGVLQYLAEPGQDLTKAEVIAPRLFDEDTQPRLIVREPANGGVVTAPKIHELLLMVGDLGQKKPVHDVVLRGLTFSHSDWELPPNGYADTQAAIATHGDVLLRAVVDCRVEECRFAHLAGYALELGRGCQRNRIVGNEMFDLGGGGVRIGETAIREDEFDRTFGQVLTDNHMHALGRVYPPAVGVLVLQSGRNRIAHNHIHDLYYTAVSVGWNWGYQETPCRENIVEFNHMHDIGQGMLSDMGAVYTLGIQKGTIIRNNLVHDVNSFTYGGWGLYPDEGTTDTIWENNVVYRTKSAGFHQHYGRENIIRNNIVAFGKEHQLMRTREEAHISFIITNNIVYFDSGDLLGSNWKNDHYAIDGNIYFDARPGASAEGMTFAGASLDQWRQRGHDTNSIIADPLFADASKCDFRLKENSPALKLGFKQIDISNVGVRPKEKRD